MSFNEKIMLNDGRQMPLLGLGVYKAVGENEVEQALSLIHISVNLPEASRSVYRRSRSHIQFHPAVRFPKG